VVGKARVNACVLARGLSCGGGVCGYVTWGVVWVWARTMSLNCCSHWPITRAAQFVFVCGWWGEEGGRGGVCLKAVGLFCCRCAGERETLGTCAGALLQPLPEGEVGHGTGVLDTHVGNRVGGVVVVVVGGSI
jgi:hypothetical protein